MVGRPKQLPVVSCQLPVFCKEGHSTGPPEAQQLKHDAATRPKFKGATCGRASSWPWPYRPFGVGCAAAQFLSCSAFGGPVKDQTPCENSQPAISELATGNWQLATSN